MNNSYLDGIYGIFTIDSMDQREVLGYRIAFLIIGVSFAGLLLQWETYGGAGAWPWIFPLITSLGLALRWIHIYLRFLHRALQLLWLIGTVSVFVLALRNGFRELLPLFVHEPFSIWAVAPFFASVVGVGIKEFFCFHRLEAIGVVLFLPAALLGYLSGYLAETMSFTLLISSSFLLLILAIQKFSVKSSADIGDKSIFNYLEAQRRGM
ncbi:hypothetical protein PMYN1_Chma616 (chromatophore) [Paulinella micropora]|uniref:Conserved hypothetical membrane protein n=1 Tax=Paulinella micropora TaxID=1928728 RepID=A0A1L5YCK5_9EUKA|nr:conserved hypothetical membrane protein [Paulinella micropora]AQX45203.1 conserved hypothetical membrane protein [Paulinella micropora]BBL86421.1 hypothetical protein PMYN1_Chma616 [Paulinella micropora]